MSNLLLCLFVFFTQTNQTVVHFEDGQYLCFPHDQNIHISAEESLVTFLSCSSVCFFVTHVVFGAKFSDFG